MRKKNSKINKTMIIIKKIIIYFLKIVFVLLILYSISYNINKIFYKKEFVKIGQIGIITENKDCSMNSNIKWSDLIIASRGKKMNLKKDDIIVYYINKNIYIQRICNIQVDNGKPYYITKGDNNLYTNIEKITEKDIIGKIALKISLLGIIARIFQNSYICLFLIIFSIYMIIYKIAIYINTNKMFKLHN